MFTPTLRLIRSLRSPAARPLLLALGFLCLNAACASMYADGERERVRRQRSEEHVYQRPAAQVWAELERLLEERSTPLLKEAAATGQPRESAWKGPDSERSKLRVRVIPMKGDRCKVELLRMTLRRTGDGGVDESTERDHETEWALLKRLDPDEADKIDREADARADEAYQSCSRCISGPPPSKSRS